VTGRVEGAEGVEGAVDDGAGATPMVTDGAAASVDGRAGSEPPVELHAPAATTSRASNLRITPVHQNDRHRSADTRWRVEAPPTDRVDRRARLDFAMRLRQ
jgi:hypothetical protein